MKYSKNILVSFDMCDTKGNLGLKGSFTQVQNAVSEAFGTINIDNISLKNKYNSMWLFVKNKIIFHKNALWGSTIKIEIFPVNVGRITCIMKTVAYEMNEIIFESYLECCVVNCVTKRFCRLADIGFLQDEVHEDFNFMKIDFEGSLKESIIIKSSNIDFSHHTNNIEYIRLFFDTYSVCDIEKMKIEDFEIHYVKESKENDEILIYTKNIGDTILAKFVLCDKNICLIKMTYKNME